MCTKVFFQLLVRDAFSPHCKPQNIMVYIIYLVCLSSRKALLQRGAKHKKDRCGREATKVGYCGPVSINTMLLLCQCHVVYCMRLFIIIELIVLCWHQRSFTFIFTVRVERSSYILPWFSLLGQLLRQKVNKLVCALLRRVCFWPACFGLRRYLKTRLFYTHTLSYHTQGGILTATVTCKEHLPKEHGMQSQLSNQKMMI